MNDKIIPPIPLRWVKNDLKGAEFIFRGKSPNITYLTTGIINADFNLTYE